VVYGYLAACITLRNPEQSFNIPMRHEICTSSLPTSTTSNDYAPQRQSHLAFTQTCRQVRAEYSPIYAKHVLISITFTRLIEYIKAAKPDDMPVLPSGSIAVYTESCSRFRYEAAAVDVMPLVRFRIPIFHSLCILDKPLRIHWASCANLARTRSGMRRLGRTSRLCWCTLVARSTTQRS